MRSTFSRGITVQRWRIRVPEGLDGKAIFFSQLSETRIDVLARLVRLDGTVQLERILPVSPSFVGRPSPGPLEVVRTYTTLGVEHILFGFDHLLFVLALVLLVKGTGGCSSHHGVHRGTQSDARRGDARLGAGAGAAS